MAFTNGTLSGPALWYLNRGTGVVLLMTLSLAIVLGTLSTSRASATWWPRFLTQGLHRNVSLLCLTLVLLHAGTAVADGFVDIRWWQALLPWGGTYRPFWLALGTAAFDLMMAAVATSLLRHRISPTLWRWVHLSTYAVFAVGLAHGLGIGTDATEPWSLAITMGCLAAVLAATTGRVVGLFRVAHREQPAVSR